MAQGTDLETCLRKRMTMTCNKTLRLKYCKKKNEIFSSQPFSFSVKLCSSTVHLLMATIEKRFVDILLKQISTCPWFNEIKLDFLAEYVCIDLRSSLFENYL